MFLLGVTSLLPSASAAGCRREMWGNSFPSQANSPLPHSYTNSSDLPSAWDWRNVDGVNYVSRDLNQHIPEYCGSCWLHAGVGVLNDRLKIARKAQWPDVGLARQVILNCGGEIAGSCQGGSDYGVYVFANKFGLPDDTCQLYSAHEYECTAFRNCMNCDPRALGGECFAVQKYGRYFVSEFGKVQLGDDASANEKENFDMVHAMKSEIFRRGPISCGVDSSVVENGKYNPGDIVTETRPAEDWTIDHDIVVVGWANDPEQGEYWIVRNSWGTYWGDKGWFKVKTGLNAMSIETDCSWAVVDAEPKVDHYGPPDWMHVFPSVAQVEMRAMMNEPALI